MIHLRTELEQLRAENQGVWAIHGEDMARAQELKAENGMLRAKLLSIEAVPVQLPPPPPSVPEISIGRAAAEGNLDVLRAWLETTGPLEYSVNALDEASINGHFHVLKWWRTQQDPRLPMRYSTRAVDGASARGDNTMLSWWKTVCGGDLLCTNQALDLAIQNGHVKTVKWWEHSSGKTLWPSAHSIEVATTSNDVAMLDVLNEALDLSGLVPRNPIVLAMQNDAPCAAYWWLKYPKVPVAENALHALSLIGETDMISKLLRKFGGAWFDLNLVSRNFHQYTVETENWWRYGGWL
ncbi:hypothetical protein H9P43_009070 [Blastocladiella emersonii ATCC 22665]|nr:hypothetical protein H9P43_009070 [Blastocladiella emersonii ATCC 22665]